MPKSNKIDYTSKRAAKKIITRFKGDSGSSVPQHRSNFRGQKSERRTAGSTQTLPREATRGRCRRACSLPVLQNEYTNTQTHKHTNTQTHKHTNTQTHTHTHARTIGEEIFGPRKPEANNHSLKRAKEKTSSDTEGTTKHYRQTSES